MVSGVSSLFADDELIERVLSDPKCSPSKKATHSIDKRNTSLVSSGE